MTPKEYLSQYRTLDVEINSKLEQVAQLRALAAKVSPSTGFGAAGGISDRVGKTVAKIIDLENEINDDIDKLVELKREIREKIKSIDSRMQRTILEEVYFNKRTFAQIAEEFNCSEKWISLHHRQGLKKIIL